MFGERDGDVTIKENPDIDDSDNDDLEFEDAKDEEEEDKIMESVKKSKMNFGNTPDIEGTLMRRFTSVDNHNLRN